LRCTDAARAFRAWEQERLPGAARLPIYALTANVLEEHRLECEQAGMDSFATKPLRANVLAELRQHATAYAQLASDARR
jgi:CheY-like chemotaxis protein